MLVEMGDGANTGAPHVARWGTCICKIDEHERSNASLLCFVKLQTFSAVIIIVAD
jgi:hypothetical protein